MKTSAGRARIEMANERLDKTVTELGEKQLAQGEKVESADEVVQRPPQFQPVEPMDSVEPI